MTTMTATKQITDQGTNVWDGPWDEEIPEYSLVGGIACRKCGCPALVDIGLECRSQRIKPRRRRWYMCPACFSRTVIPDKVGKKIAMGKVTLEAR